MPSSSLALKVKGQSQMSPYSLLEFTVHSHTKLHHFLIRGFFSYLHGQTDRHTHGQTLLKQYLPRWRAGEKNIFIDVFKVHESEMNFQHR